MQDNVKILLEKYKLDTGAHDVIIGYRADDSYFAYAEAFVSGTIYKDTLEKALRTGELGIQVFIKGERAFDMPLRSCGWCVLYMTVWVLFVVRVCGEV